MTLSPPLEPCPIPQVPFLSATPASFLSDYVSFVCQPWQMILSPPLESCPIPEVPALSSLDPFVELAFVDPFCEKVW